MTRTPQSEPERQLARRLRGQGRQAIAAACLLVAALGLANLAGSRLSARVDLTGDRVYTLSPGSRAMVRSLPDPLTVKAYFSSDLPPAQAAVARYARELLDEYRLASGGQVTWQVEDPAGDPRAEEQASRCRIGKIAIQTHQNNKMEVAQRYLGLCLWYDGKSRALAPIDPGAGLEYQISALIKQMSGKRRKVAFTVGHGERDLGTDYTFVRRALEHELDVVTIDPSAGPIGVDVNLLIVAGPRRPFEDGGRRAIEAHLAQGRPALFLLDGMSLDVEPGAGAPDRVTPHPVTTGLEPLLASYGFRVGRDLVFDRRNVPGPLPVMGAGPSPGIANSPAFVAVRPDRALAAELSIMAGIDALVLPFPSAVEHVEPAAANGAASAATNPARVWALARSSAESWTDGGAFSLTGGESPGHGPGARGPAILGYAYQGPPRPSSNAAASLRLVIVGSSELVADRYMELMRTFPIYAGGAELLLNAVGWSLEDDGLTALRAAVLRARPLDVDAADGAAGGRAALIQWANVAGVPLALCVAGLLRWRWRTAARRRQRFAKRDGGAR